MTGMIEPRHLTVSLPRGLPCESDLDYSQQAIEIICAPSGGGPGSQADTASRDQQDELQSARRDATALRGFVAFRREAVRRRR